MDLADLLRAGDLDKFHDARDGEDRPDLFAEELDGLDLTGVDLTGAQLDKSDLTGSILRDARLIRASLCEIDGVGLVIADSIALGARFREALIDDSDLSGAELSHADFTGAHLNSARAAGARLNGAKLKDVKAKGIVLSGADLTEAGLKGADLSGADLSGAKLNEAQGGSTQFTGARMDGVDATNARFGGSNFVGASLVGAVLVGVQLGAADLSGADLSGADLTKANLAGATLAGARLRGAKLADACLDGVDLSTCDIDGADLTGLDVGALGLDSTRAATLKAHGAVAHANGPRVVRDPSVAASGDTYAAVWRNPEDDGKDTVRWAVFGGAEEQGGVLPVSAASVVHLAVVAAADAFRIVLLVARSDGATLLSWPLSADGVLGASVASALGYDPMVIPVITGGANVRVVGLGRRGPTLVAHVDPLDGTGFKPAFGATHAQARTFASRTASVLLGKGGVAWSIGASGVGAPVRIPDAISGVPSTVIPVGAGLVAVWATQPIGRTPGTVRVLPLGSRTARDPDELDVGPVAAIDALGDGDGALVTWVEAGKDGATRARFSTWPGLKARTVEAAGEAVVSARAWPGPNGGLVAATTVEGRLFVADVDGTVRARLG